MEGKMKWGRAHRLGCAFGHSWASVIEAHEAESIADAEKLTALYEERCAARVAAGEQAFYVYGVRPALEHTTMTGRTSWTIRPNGHVEVLISRPTGPCLRAVIGERDVDSMSFESEDSRARHWYALFEVTCAVLGWKITASYDEKAVPQSEYSIEHPDYAATPCGLSEVLRLLRYHSYQESKERNSELRASVG